MRSLFSRGRFARDAVALASGVDTQFVSKHRRIAILRDGTRLYEFNATKTRPHLVKRKRRAANRRARSSRKANRR